MILNIKKGFVLSLILYFFTSSLMFAQQEKYIKHTVVQGETVTQIAQKYKVTPFDIYKLNPDSQNGVQLNSVLLIPANGTTTTANKVIKPSQTIRPATTHLVQPKETLFSLSKVYNVSVDAIKNANVDLLKADLQIGQNLIIPAAEVTANSFSDTTASTAKSEVKTTVIKQTNSQVTFSSSTKYHVIAPKETKFGIAKQYDVTIQDLERLNPEIVNDFPIGLKLIISEKIASKEVSNSPKSSSTSTTSSSKASKIFLEQYIVKPSETVYSICKEKGISEQELLELNPELKDGLKLGMFLRVPKIKKHETFSKSKMELATTVTSAQKKNLVLLLPFNISKIQNDTINSTEARLKKDKFLNLTLDFYSGALMAIDSAKTLGLNVDIKIFDSQETKNSFSLAELISNNNLVQADAIIGPFYQSNVEKLAEWLKDSNTAIISPLSKEYNKSYPNLYQSLPSEDKMRNTMFDFMRSKQGNIVAIIDSKKQSVYDYFAKNQPDVKIIGLSDTGTLIADSLMVRLSNTRPNYAVLVTEKTSMIINATNIMQRFKKDYQIQLAILEYNETLDFEEVKLSSLTNLNMMYPSITKPNDSQTNTNFENSYKRKNNIYPNQFAVRGFDVTFDALLRLSQERTFEETVQSVSTEYVENRFDYVPSESGYSNNGVFVLYYDNDLTIKEAK